MKTRLDKLLVEQRKAASRELAQALILAGRVLVNEQKVEKPGAPVEPEAELRVLGEQPRYVSRGGRKLEAAIEYWTIDLANRNCADIGASTGGFTDCMLQHGAKSVIAIDTGYGQIAERLRTDPRVTLRERTNARYLAPGSLPPDISFLAVDVAFISATLVLAPVVAARGLSLPHPSKLRLPGTPAPGSCPLEVVILIKPQFEAGREYVGKGGIVRDPTAHQLAIDRVRKAVDQLGAQSNEVIDSPILGAEGNREFLLHVVL